MGDDICGEVHRDIFWRQTECGRAGLIGEISFYTLKNNFVDIFRIEENIAVKEVIERYYNNQLEEITAPTHPVEESHLDKPSEDLSP